MNSSGAAASTANQESTSVSRSLIGCHWRSEMNGATVPLASICGQLCTRLRLGNRVAADTMKPLSATSARWRVRPRCRHGRDHRVRVAHVAQLTGEIAAGRQLVGGARTGPGRVEGALLALAGLRLAEQPDVHHAGVGMRRVVAVAGEVLRADLPVGLDPPALRAAQLDARRALAGVKVQVEREVAEVVAQRRSVRVQADEDQPVVGVHRRRGQQGLARGGRSRPRRRRPPAWKGRPASRPSLR